MLHVQTAPRFETARLILRPFEHRDCDAIVECLNDMDMCRWLTLVPYPYTAADAKWFVEEAAADALAVCTKDGALVGAMGLGNQLGYWIGKAHWRNGYAYEAAHAVVADHFARSDADITSGYADGNAGSARVLEKLRFEITHDRMLPIRSLGKDVPAKALTLTRARWEALQ